VTTLPFSNLSKGELAPELQARIDTAQYEAGAKRLRNFIIQRYGGASFRPGFRFVGEVEDVATTPRYLPFQYNIEQSYIMALEDQQMRFLTGGGFVLEEDLQITAISKAANAQLTVAFHDYVVGQRLYFSGIVGMTELNYQTGRVVSVVDANNFTIDIDTTSYSTFVSSVGTARVGAPTPVPPDPPLTSGGGGSGSDVGELPGWKLDMLNRGGVD
jgi:hypothetical protein